MLLEVAPYRQGDAGTVAIGAPSAAELVNWPEAERILLAHRGFTLHRDGAPIACALFEPHWVGYARLVALIGDVGRRDWPTIRDFAIAALDRWQEQYRRIDASIRADRPGHRRFIERLGFRIEGVMEAYGPEGADYLLAARVRRSVEGPV